MVDVSQHELVPDHVLIDDPDEIQAILDEYDVRKTDLPKIKRTDPATPDDAEVGDVVKIIRDSRTTDQAVVYRLVLS